MSVLIIFAFRYKYKKLNELYFLVTLILVALLIFLFLFNKIYTQVFLGNGTFFEQFFSYLSDRAKVTNIGNAKINLDNLNFIQKIFSIIFGPSYFIFSFSNLIFFIDKIYLFFILTHVLLIDVKFNKTKENYLSLFEQALLLFACLMCLILSLSVSNYGIALRLKLMFLPIFFYFIIKKQNSIKFELKMIFFFDFVFTFFINLFLPLGIVIALLILIFDGVPIFYNSKRIGKNFKLFKIYKFRTMEINKTKDKITSLGKILRRTSLDELPQFFNVLKGDMSLVGPRPFPKETLNKLSREKESLDAVLNQD